MSKPNAFDVLKLMASRNKDIQSTNTVTDIRMVKLGGHVTFGVTGALAQALMATEKYNVFLMAYDVAQFKEIEAELSRVSDRTESPEPVSGEDLEGERGGEERAETPQQ